LQKEAFKVGLLPNPSTAQNSKIDVAHNLIIWSNLDLTPKTENKCQISVVLACVHQSWQKKLLRNFRNKDRGEECTTERESLPWWIEGKNPAAASSSQKFDQKAPNSNFLQEHQNCPHLPKMPKISKIIQFTEPKPPWTTVLPLPATPP